MSTAPQDPGDSSPTDKLPEDVSLEPTTTPNQIDPVTSTPDAQSKKNIIIERLILCTALFFPLFLATLDTSATPKFQSR